MVTILPPRQRQSFGSQLGSTIGQSLSEGFTSRLNEKEDAKRQAQKLAADEERDLRKIALQEQLKGQRSKELEEFKQMGKRQMQQEQMNLLERLMGGPKQNEMAQELIKGDSELSQEDGRQFRPEEIDDAAIAQISTMNPNLGRLLQQQKDVALRESRAEREFQLKEKERAPETIREKQLTSAQANADVKYNQELQSAHKQHEIKSKTLDRLEILNKKGVTGKPYERLLEKFGLVSLTSEGRREFAADVKNLITDIRSILGGQFSQFEFQTILNAYPSADFSKEANDAIIKNLKDFQEIRNQEFKIANQLKKENQGKVPMDFQSQVNDRLQKYAQDKLPEIRDNVQTIMRERLGVAKGHTILLDPNGEPLAVPNDEVEAMLNLGAEYP